MGKEVLYNVKKNIAVITINSPDTNNAFSESLLSEWHQCLKRAKDDDNVKGVILTATGRVFCSGGSIGDMVDGKMSGWDMKNFLRNNVHKIALEMKSFYKPVVAAINGAAIGAGLDMALMCDFRIASEKAIFAEAYIKLGLIAGDGGCYFLPRVIGIPKALEMLLTGKVLKVEEALEWGLINKVVEHKNLLEESIKYLNNIIQWPAEAVQLMKKMVYASERQTLEDHLNEVSSHMGMLSSREEFKTCAEKLLLQINKK